MTSLKVKLLPILLSVVSQAASVPTSAAANPVFFMRSTISSVRPRGLKNAVQGMETSAPEHLVDHFEIRAVVVVEHGIDEENILGLVLVAQQHDIVHHRLRVAPAELQRPRARDRCSRRICRCSRAWSGSRRCCRCAGRTPAAARHTAPSRCMSPGMRGRRPDQPASRGRCPLAALFANSTARTSPSPTMP